jgi:hypothetical protein
VFYVTDLTGSKVAHPSRQAAIRRHLRDVLHGPVRDSGKDAPPLAAGARGRAPFQ